MCVDYEGVYTLSCVLINMFHCIGDYSIHHGMNLTYLSKGHYFKYPG